jgi:malonyl CoA-acyl carrier protein transacylase
MAAAGVTRFIAFGLGRLLTGLAKRLIPGAELVNVSGIDALEKQGAASK